MNPKQLLIKNAKIVSAKETMQGDILIENGIITQINKEINNSDALTIDALNNFVTPGGIDPHVHFGLKTKKASTADNFYEGSVAALTGGTTTCIDFITPERHEPLLEAARKRIKEASESIIDYSLHGSITSWDEYTYNDMKACLEKEGISSFKVYMAYKNSIGINDNVLFRTFKAAHELGILVLTHCENGDVIELLQEEALSKKQYEAKYHPLTCPAQTEAEAINRAIMMASLSNSMLYVVHVSTKKGLKLIKKAQKNKRKVFAETCPHYLLLTDGVYKNNKNPETFIMSPPLRTKKDNEALFKALKKNEINVVATDHCSFMLNDKTNKNNFTQIPGGVAGVENRLSLLFTYGVLSSKISVNRFVELTATNPAKLFGLYPQKGTISIGSDADLVIWEMINKNISNKELHHKSDHSIYEGFKIKAQPATVICKGIVAYDKGKLNINGLKGRYLKRNKCTADLSKK